MNERIKKLREQSLNATNKISTERAVLLTEFYKSIEARGKSAPVLRALAFKHILVNKEIPVNDGELIVGERGPEPKATSTYPEICLHTINDLEMISNRKKVSFKVDEKVKEVYEDEIIPYWENRSIRDIIFSRLSDKWKDAYEAGVFTEFLEQRAPGHTVSGNKLFRTGMKDIFTEIDEAIEALDF
ncbi:MAG: formate C-acetyltransferase/glycerol dehydratase family glycyl radical enzyme, partial [Candidatus Aminicenantes bacterium]|nr:formate C-acetyltransferase/glycerol dehydratase family glycyl radical enzyme [Candidatus Aminicenantes bacterium]